MSISRYVWVIEVCIFEHIWVWQLFEIYYSPITAKKRLEELKSYDFRLTKVKLK